MTNLSKLNPDGTSELEIIEFFINEYEEDGQIITSSYGINVAKVLEIIRMPEVTAMPEVPHPSVLGAFNLRSKIIPLIDLAMWLGRPKVKSDQDKVIVTEFNLITSAFVVSGVHRIHRLSWSEVEAPSPQITHYSDGCLTGIVKIENRIMLLLDMEKIIADLNPQIGKSLGAKIDKLPEHETLKLLLIDDSWSLRRTMCQGLEEAGFEVTQAVNGQEAWDMLLNLKAQVVAENKDISDFLDVIICDIEMPILDGISLTRRIKEDPVLKVLPVVLFSSIISDEVMLRGQAAGADEHVSKPDVLKMSQTVIRLAEAAKEA